MSGCNIGLDVKRGYTSWNLRRSYEFYDVIASRIHSNGVGSFIAFKRKHTAIVIALLLVIVLSVLILGYMWIHSPM